MTTDELLQKATARPWRKLPAPSTPEPHEVGEAFANHELQLRAVNSFEAAREALKLLVNDLKHHDYTHEGCDMCAHVRFAKQTLALMEGEVPHA